MDFLESIVRVAILGAIPLILKSIFDKEKINRERRNYRDNSVKQFTRNDIHDYKPILKEQNKTKETDYIDFVYEENFKVRKEEDTYIKKNKNKEEISEKIDDIIKQNEINDDSVFRIDFNTDDVIRGIIMSEILSKPKSLR